MSAVIQELKVTFWEYQVYGSSSGSAPITHVEYLGHVVSTDLF